MNFLYCWHRPGKIIPVRGVQPGTFRQCRHCSVAVESCPCVAEYRDTPKNDCKACEGSGWVAILRSKAAVLVQTLDLGAELPVVVIAPVSSVRPISQWGGACTRGFVSDRRFSTGDPVIPRTNRNVSRKWRALDSK